MRKTKDIRPSDFESEFNNGNIPETDNIDERNLAYNKELTQVYDKLAPVKEITITSRIQTPWFHSELNELKQKVRWLERKWTKYRLESCWEAYKVNQNAYYYLIRKKKKQFISDSVKQCGKDTKKLYKLVNALMGNNTENPMPKAKSDEELAQQFADYLLEKIQKIRKMFQDITPLQTQESDIPKIRSFSPMMESQVKKIIMEMQSKLYELDPIQTTLLNEVLHIVLPTITKIANLSLCQGEFCSAWKTATVHPLLKKLGLNLINKNYWPVSNLSFLSKIIECCMLSQFMDHCAEYNLLPAYQSA